MAQELLQTWLVPATSGEEPPLDRIVAAGFKEHKEFNSGERRWINSAVYGTVRLLDRQRFLLGRTGKEETTENLITLWQDEHTVTRPNWADSLRDAIDALPSAEDPHGYLRVTLSIPDNIATSIEAQLGDESLEAGAAFNEQAPTVLRVNTLRTRKSRITDKVADTQETRYSPLGLVLPQRVALPTLHGFKEGWFELQEEASQLATLLTDAQPGSTVVDVGAGGGGKSLALAAMMKNQGQITAIDPSEWRLTELKQRAARAHAFNISTFCPELDENGLWIDDASGTLKALENQADCVLLDAPCSGSGTMRRSPDIRWRYHSTVAFAALQLSLVRQSARFVKPGGALVYVTCALERDQNEDVIEKFLACAEGADFSIEPGKAALESGMQRAAVYCMGIDAGARWLPADTDTLFNGPFLRTWPHKHGMDAFFAARLVRSVAR